MVVLRWCCGDGVLFVLLEWCCCGDGVARNDNKSGYSKRIIVHFSAPCNRPSNCMKRTN